MKFGEAQTRQTIEIISFISVTLSTISYIVNVFRLVRVQTQHILSPISLNQSWSVLSKTLRGFTVLVLMIFNHLPN